MSLNTQPTHDAIRDRYYKIKLGLEPDDEEGRKEVVCHYLEVCARR